MNKQTVIPIAFTLVILSLIFSQQVSAQSTLQQTSSQTYQNSKYGFKIQYPSNWKAESPSSSHSIGSTLPGLFGNDVIKINAPNNNPDPMRSSANTVLTINVKNISTSLDPKTLKVKSPTAQDYGNDKVNFLSHPQDMGGLQATFDITKNIPTTISGQPAWRVDYITSLSGVQSSYQSVMFVVKNNKLYELDFFTDPLKVPEMIPIAEKMFQSFQFS